MTGTSLDGIDSALVRIEGVGLHMRAQCVGHTHAGLGELGTRLRSIAEQHPVTAAQIARAATEFGTLHAEVIRSLIGSEQIDLICCHGQTVVHAPPIGWQLLNPAPIAAAFECPIVTDLRSVDLARGGQGAPITPLADHVLFSHPTERRAVVNLGGFCNATLLPAERVEAIRGFDVCACNHVLDGLSRALVGQAYDQDGTTAARGRVVTSIADALHSALAAQGAEGRSLGTGDELIDRALATATEPADTLRSACFAIARAVGERIGAVDRVLVAGGGALNRSLIAELRSAIGVPVEATTEHRVGVEAREAVAMAVLGALCLDRVPITLSAVTGVADPPISGCVSNHHLIREHN